MAVQDCDYAFVLDHPKMRLPDADKDIDTHPVKVGRLPLRPCMSCQQRMSSHLNAVAILHSVIHVCFSAKLAIAET